MARGRGSGGPPVSLPVQFLRFLAVGLLNTLFGYAVFAVQVLAGIAPMPALVGTYLAGVPFNYFTTGRFVFGRAPRSRASFLRFVAAYVVIYVFNAVLYRAVETAVAAPLAAQALCIPVVAVFSFLLFKLHVFTDTALTGEGPR